MMAFLKDKSMGKARFFTINPYLFSYSDVYSDDKYDYRHVITPSNYRKYIPTGRLLSEAEWRSLGIQMSPGWEHYCIHNPEPYIFLFRRPTKKQESTGMARITQHQTNEV